MSTEARELEVTTSRGFTSWLAAEGSGIALTTYQTVKLFLLGVQPDGRLSVFERTLDRVMGMAVSGHSLHLSTLYQIWRFHNVLEDGDAFNG